jgi:hypothetical protein
VEINPTKIKGLRRWPHQLKNVKEVQQILGVLGYLHPLIRGFADLARPLTCLTKKDVTFEWGDEQAKTLDNLIERVTSKPVLRCTDLEKVFKLKVDASTFGIGAVLMQRDKKGKRYDVGYFSKALNNTERNYDIWD